MPLEHILNAMQTQAERRIAEISSLAEAQAARMIGEAEAEAETTRAGLLAGVGPKVSIQAAIRQNRAKLTALRTAATAREQLIVDSFQQAESSLAEIRESPDYVPIFRALAREAVRGLGDDMIATVDPRDADLARAVFAEIGVSAEIREREIPLGGLVVATGDQRIIVDDTLASRLERARDALRRPVAAILSDSSKPEPEWMDTVTPTPA